MTDIDWLAGLQVGDEVVTMRSGVGCKHGTLTAVARLTPTQIITDGGGRFRRMDGHGVGKSGYYFSWIKKPSVTRLAAIKADSSFARVKAIDWNGVPLATVEAVLVLVAKASVLKAGKARR